MPNSRSVAAMKAPFEVASNLIFVRTGFVERAGTTAAAVCTAASKGSFEQRIFMRARTS